MLTIVLHIKVNCKKFISTVENIMIKQMIKQTILILFILVNSAHANPNFVIATGMKMDRGGNMIEPDRLFMGEAIRAYNKGANQSAFNYFKKAAALGNALSQRYIGLMYINALGVEKDMVKGYAWLKLAARDGTARNLDLKKQVFQLLTPEQIKQIEINYKQVEQDYGPIAALTRRDRWVRKQKMQMTGSRTGSLVFAPLIYDTPHGNGFYNQAKSYVEDYNFGYITSGEIVPIDKPEEGE